jgi:indole-3-glycerol phosphate synthase
MTGAVPDILARIVQHKRQELRTQPLSELENRARKAISGRRDFVAALRLKPVAIISEIKQASPSKGLLTKDFRPAEIARQYAAGGAAALSVLTDARFFSGSLDDLVAARAAVSIPVLRKDFTVDEYHVVEAAAHGADAILLIAAVLDVPVLRRLRELAAAYGLAAIVEVHDEVELSRALESEAAIVGVNNRNLHTFDVALETSLRLAERIPSGILKISESGIETRDKIATLQKQGYSAFLIGEHLMRSGNPAESLRMLGC